MSESKTFANIDALAKDLRQTLDTKDNVLIYAYNGIGKTRLSMAFKDAGKKVVTNQLISETGDTLVDESGNSIISEEEVIPDTLYYNAFTEDLFTWDNDLDNNTQRALQINRDSRFFNGLQELEMENRIRPLLQRYADFDFFIDYATWKVNFIRDISDGDTTKVVENIKVSRGEENIFIWCFFLAIAQLAIDEQEAYQWVKFLYIDDPISSLDDNNAIAVASHLAQILKKPENKIKAVISSHHTLFFNVMCNELKKARKYFLNKDENKNGYILHDTRDTPRFYHVAMLKELHNAAETSEIYTYHFNILRNILEKTAAFHGFNNFSACIKKDANDENGTIHTRIISLLNHGNYSLFEPVKMLEENKEHFKKILNDFMGNYRFNPELFPEKTTQERQL